MTSKIAVLTALILLSIIAGCNTKKETSFPTYTWHDTTKAAMRTHGTYMQDYNSRENPTWSYEIPQQFWTRPIRDLKPLRVYLHYYNLVVVQKINYNTEEEGIYINMPISSLSSLDALEGKDGFILTEELEYGHKYKRTIE